MFWHMAGSSALLQICLLILLCHHQETEGIQGSEVAWKLLITKLQSPESIIRHVVLRAVEIAALLINRTMQSIPLRRELLGELIEVATHDELLENRQLSMLLLSLLLHLSVHLPAFKIYQKQGYDIVKLAVNKAFSEKSKDIPLPDKLRAFTYLGFFLSSQPALSDVEMQWIDSKYASVLVDRSENVFVKAEAIRSLADGLRRTHSNRQRVAQLFPYIRQLLVSSKVYVAMQAGRFVSVWHVPPSDKLLEKVPMSNVSFLSGYSKRQRKWLNEGGSAKRASELQVMNGNHKEGDFVAVEDKKLSFQEPHRIVGSTGKTSCMNSYTRNFELHYIHIESMAVVATRYNQLICFLHVSIRMRDHDRLRFQHRVQGAFRCPRRRQA